MDKTKAIQVLDIKTDYGLFFFSNIIYCIKCYRNDTIIYTNNGKFLIRKSPFSTVKLICSYYLIDLEGYLRAMKRMKIKGYLPPIICSNSLVFQASKRFRDFDTIWFNLSLIRSIVDRGTHIIIKYSEYIFEVNINLKKLKKMIESFEQIKKYLETIHRD